MRRASSVLEVEYELLRFLRDKIDITQLQDSMAVDAVSTTRCETAIGNVCKLLDNMCDRRLHRLPKDHTDYKEK